jgi:diacylglycerol O-acyltransferase / wax synthase
MLGLHCATASGAHRRALRVILTLRRVASPDGSYTITEHQYQEPPTRRSYEPLSAQDASFLAYERGGLHMHVGVVAIFEGGSFRLAGGGLDFEKLERYVLARLASWPRMHQKLTRTPVARRPVWIDDRRFRPEEHTRRVTLEAGGGESALKRLASEVFSQPLDRSRPLWEATFVDGLDDDAFAIVFKTHHGAIDGIAGMDFIGALLTSEGTPVFADAPLHRAVSPPSRLHLFLDDVLHYASAPLRFLDGLRILARDGEARVDFRDRAFALVHVVANGLRGTSPNPLSTAPVTLRTIDWATADASGERAIRSRLGGTRDDVTLAASTGAVRGFLRRRRVGLSRLRIRAMVPVNLRTRSERGGFGNRVSTLIVDLPVAEAEARAQLEQISETVAHLKQVKQGLGGDVLAQIDQWTGTLAQRMGMWLAKTRRAYNLCVTTIPGSPTALYALESKMVALYAVAPVFHNQLFNISALTYAGKLHWGVHYAGEDADAAAEFVADLDASFSELVAAAAAAPPRIRVVATELDAGAEALRAAGAE